MAAASELARTAKPSTTLCLITLELADSTLLILEEKQRGSLRVSTQEAPWILPTLARFSNTGIVVGLKTPLTLDVLLLLIPHMMIDSVENVPQMMHS